ncbi:MAG: hypothetical protein IPI67_26560 [Myxococcales bacterium]|nr:hypothetical protein [Myxococcales bacterium]
MVEEVSRTLLTVDEFARLVGVSPGTVRNWKTSGALPTETVEGTTLVDYAEVAGRKLLRETELLNLPAVKQAQVSETDVTAAIVAGGIAPTAAPDRRYSINDGAALVAWKGGGSAVAVAGVPLEGGPQQNTDSTGAALECGPDHSGRFEALIEYVTVHADPARIPATFWDTRVCPEFVPPVGVFRAWYGGRGAEGDDSGPLQIGTAIGRSATWELEDGQLVQQPATDLFGFAEGDDWHEPGSLPPEYAAVSLRYRELERAWREAWLRRRRELLAAGVSIEALPHALAFERRDRVAAIERYHREHLSPADLPDWFFCTEECPPFVPPTGVFRFEYRESDADPYTGQPRTWVCSTEGWAQEIGKPGVSFIPAQRVHRAPGTFRSGATPPEHGAANQRYGLAEHEWREEWRHRVAFYRAEGGLQRQAGAVLMPK